MLQAFIDEYLGYLCLTYYNFVSVCTDTCNANCGTEIGLITIHIVLNWNIIIMAIVIQNLWNTLMFLATYPILITKILNVIFGQRNVLEFRSSLFINWSCFLCRSWSATSYNLNDCTIIINWLFFVCIISSEGSIVDYRYICMAWMLR